MSNPIVPTKVRRREVSICQTYEADGSVLLKTMREGVMRDHDIRPGESPYIADAVDGIFAIDKSAEAKMRDLVDVLAELEDLLTTNGGTLVLSIEVRQ